MRNSVTGMLGLSALPEDSDEASSFVMPTEDRMPGPNELNAHTGNIESEAL